jgi:hypothetical protein
MKMAGYVEEERNKELYLTEFILLSSLIRGYMRKTAVHT